LVDDEGGGDADGNDDRQQCGDGAFHAWEPRSGIVGENRQYKDERGFGEMEREKT
jgi:hypothetical protein